MNIGFDAKRIFLNNSGLGNYSRNTLNMLSRYYPDNNYHLFTPKYVERNESFIDKAEIHLPSGFVNKRFPSLWRSRNIVKDIAAKKIDIYHGLSNELPKGIHRIQCRSVITIHDMIIHRFPEWYKNTDSRIYKLKFKAAFKESDTIIAISEQTKADIQEFYNIDSERIKVVYQGCNPIFRTAPKPETLASVKTKYKLPESFILFVGTIEKRKNVLQVVKAMHQHCIDVPLYIIGRNTPYVNEIRSYLTKHKLQNVHLLHNVNNTELHAFYYLSSLFVYPSIFEGFGIPILEAISSGTPVLTSKGSCFSEAGGTGSVYVDPKDTEEIGFALKEIIESKSKQTFMIEQGLKHADKFTDDKIAKNLITVYNNML